MSVVIAPSVRQVEIDPDCPADDYHAARLWCPECNCEPVRYVRCRTCPQIHVEVAYGPFLDCNACGADLIWVVVVGPDGKTWSPSAPRDAHRMAPLVPFPPELDR